MLHCNMNNPLSPALHRDLEDVLGSLQHARRTGDLGRLALLTYWDVRKWARYAQREALAALAAEAIATEPHASREAFLSRVDQVIVELESIRSGLH
jgi:hypothetical protein